MTHLPSLRTVLANERSFTYSAELSQTSSTKAELLGAFLGCQALLVTSHPCFPAPIRRVMLTVCSTLMEHVCLSVFFDEGLSWMQGLHVGQNEGIGELQKHCCQSCHPRLVCLLPMGRRL